LPAGSARQFDLERFVVCGEPSDETLEAYDRAVRGSRGDWEALVAVDRAGFDVIGPDELVRPWPPSGVDLARWRIDPPLPAGLLEDGDELELGDRTLRVAHTPGGAPDHVCLLDERAGILLAQDQACYGPHLLATRVAPTRQVDENGFRTRTPSYE
jgi:glyoxylase-like metal-dependent hydrolase (beta-lactamase superfamily II)